MKTIHKILLATFTSTILLSLGTTVVITQKSQIPKNIAMDNTVQNAKISLLSTNTSTTDSNELPMVYIAIKNIKSNSVVQLDTALEASVTPSQMANIKTQVIQAIQNYQSNQASLSTDTATTNSNDVYVNDALLKMDQARIAAKNAIDDAAKKGEKLYSDNEILNAKTGDFGLTADGLAKIKSIIVSKKIDTAVVIATAKTLGNEGKAYAKQVRANLDNFKIPASMITAPTSNNTSDGTISGNGFPACLDDNGYGSAPGHNNFWSSDCEVAWLEWFTAPCSRDLTSNRYCKYYVNNCSPSLGHSIWYHDHSSWWKFFIL